MSDFPNNFITFTASQVYEIDKYNYVGNRGIYWTHTEAPYMIRVTDDYEQCVKGNRSNDNTCWWYFSSPTLPIMKRDFNEQDIIDIINELKNWKLMQRFKNSEWASTVTRIYNVMKDVPYEQKVFATKHYSATFYTDDVIETLNAHSKYHAIGGEFNNHLLQIWNGVYNKEINLNQFRDRDNIPDEIIDDAITVLQIQTELGVTAAKLLKRKVYDLFLHNCRDFFEGTSMERPLFLKHTPLKTFIGQEEGRDARIRSIGLCWILPANMTSDRMALNLSSLNPLIDLVAWTVTLQDDIVSYCKERTSDTYSPMSFPNSLIQSGMTDLEAARQIINECNEAVKAYDTLWKHAPSDRYEYYEYLAKYSMTLLDFYLCSGLEGINSRYGWTPSFD